ncbi:hypothetical protein JTE90_009262 [Oedothorax gibbosus]|uniref:Uncharacterized protein n=1 Tax=Oedothorax gibbosus TaxID=931172 RepID=A0AAV6V0T5_9ARAC|nr:hypothetical protein JTE90_009262 [Oedothorax gibbosus]
MQGERLNRLGSPDRYVSKVLRLLFQHQYSPALVHPQPPTHFRAEKTDRLVILSSGSEPSVRFRTPPFLPYHSTGLPDMSRDGVGGASGFRPH